jgi:hypothetical protein
MKCMKVLLFAAFIAITMPGTALYAQCPFATVSISGTILNIPRRDAHPEVTVIVQTQKKRATRSIVPENGAFKVDVTVGTQSSSYFPLWGHRCKDLPKAAIVQLHLGDQPIVERRLDFPEDFEETSTYHFRLKRDLMIDASASVL